MNRIIINLIKANEQTNKRDKHEQRRPHLPKPQPKNKCPKVLPPKKAIQNNSKPNPTILIMPNQ